MTLALAIIWAYAHAIAESVSIPPCSIHGRPEPNQMDKPKEAHAFFVYVLRLWASLRIY